MQLQNLLLGLVLLHLAAIAYYTVWKRSDLARAMVTGQKSVPETAADAEIDEQQRRGPVWLAALIVLGLALLLWAAITYLPPPPTSSWG